MRKSRAVQLNKEDAQNGGNARGGSRGRLLFLLLFVLLVLVGFARPVRALAAQSDEAESAAQLAIPITVELMGDEGAPPDETYVISVQAESIGRLPEGAYVTEESSEGTTADSLPVTIDEETLTLLVETAAGSFYVGPVTFDEAGGYVYTITQIPGDNPAITYDDTVYYFTVVVTRDADGELVMQAYAFREGLDEKVDEIVFVNVYKEPSEGEEPGEEPGTPSEEEPEESGTDSGTTEDDEDEEEEGEKETDELPPTEEEGPTGDDTPGDGTTGGPGSPLTGDDSQLLLYLILALASAAVLLVLILVLVRRRKKAASGTPGEETSSETAEKEISFGTAEEETFAGDAEEESSAGTAQEKEQQPAETVDQPDADDNADADDDADAGRPEMNNMD